MSTPCARLGRRLAMLGASLALLGCIELEPAARPPAGTDAGVREAVAAINDHRRSIGCRPLAWDEELAAVARRHSEDMAARGFYGHRTPEGAGPVERLAAAGIPWRATAENIARTEFGAEQVVYLWLQSESHRTNIENCRFDRHGLALVRDLWTHVFVESR
jgi:uncharacterized protein YkwD